MIADILQKNPAAGRRALWHGVHAQKVRSTPLQVRRQFSLFVFCFTEDSGGKKRMC